MKELVEALCSDACAGRAAGTPGGARGRALVVDALRGAGLDPFEQQVPGCNGANVIASLPGDVDRWVLVAAHHDHLGTIGRDVFRGADDNAAAVAILVETARALAARRPDGRGVIVAAFDSEEPPYFMTGAMGSEHFARNPIVPLDRIDMMVCMDLCGHAFGPPGLPGEVRETLFALGAERSEGTAAVVDAIERAAPGVIVRRADAEIVPPLSDYAAFWERERPFLFLTCGRSRVYHTPEDVPEALDWPKMAATARWLERFVRDSCARDARIAFVPDGRDDAATLRGALAITSALRELSDLAAAGHAMAEGLLAACDASGRLPRARRGELEMLVAQLEAGLAG